MTKPDLKTRPVVAGQSKDTGRTTENDSSKAPDRWIRLTARPLKVSTDGTGLKTKNHDLRIDRIYTHSRVK